MVPPVYVLHAISETGGRLPLAVLNGQLSYPSPDPYHAEVQSLIQACLTVDHIAFDG